MGRSFFFSYNCCTAEKTSAESGFSKSLKPKGYVFKVRAFRHSFFTQQPIADRLSSYQVERAYEFVRFSVLCRKENRSKNQGFNTENSRKTQVAHSPSVAPRQLPLGGSLWFVRVFSLCQRAISANIQRYRKRFSESHRVNFRTDSVLFRSIPHPLRGSSLCIREPWVGAFSALCHRKNKRRI